MIRRLTLLIAASLIAVPAFAKGDESQNTVELSQTAKPGQRLEIHLETGAGIEIRGWSGSRVVAHTDYHESDCPNAEVRLFGIDDGARLETRWKKDAGDDHSCSMTIVVQVPRHFDVTVDSPGGEIGITDVEGVFEGRTGGGSIDLDHVRGEVRLRTGGGSIDVRDSDLDGTIRTGGGEAHFENVRGDVTATSGSMRRTLHGEPRDRRSRN